MRPCTSRKPNVSTTLAKWSLMKKALINDKWSKSEARTLLYGDGRFWCRWWWMRAQSFAGVDIAVLLARGRAGAKSTETGCSQRHFLSGTAWLKRMHRPSFRLIGSYTEEGAMGRSATESVLSLPLNARWQPAGGLSDKKQRPGSSLMPANIREINEGSCPKQTAVSAT